MTLTDLIDHLLISTGEYIVENLENIFFDNDKLWRVILPQLKYYGKHRPLTLRKQIYLNAFYEFADTPTIPAPDWISSVVPCDLASPLSIFNSVSAGPKLMPWRYDKPKLYMLSSISSSFEVTCHYSSYPFTITRDGLGKITEVDIPDIDESDDKFLEMIRGKFIEAIGMSRRAFTLQDFPILMDAAELVIEGREIFNNAKDGLEERNSWWHAIGG